ncbi:hypothetical protein K701_26900 [Streptomyces fradiae ATCC 10745 = DSM 40063]|uniref:Uncharacterized protein n=1 Tax=Streptomyces fradiae ATCC 10745 = DSM 40063 TaxID=1319510 RepID=A0ABQ6XNC8_STRFR|nr:hypothetical protein K701_26900 [Streptomyces fradiae ATCC 10745 = DSM 40063]
MKEDAAAEGRAGVVEQLGMCRLVVRRGQRLVVAVLGEVLAIPVDERVVLIGLLGGEQTQRQCGDPGPEFGKDVLVVMTTGHVG